MAFQQPRGKQAEKKQRSSPQRQPNCWLCSGCNWWQFAFDRGTTNLARSCFRTEKCGIAKGKGCTQWKDATDAQKKHPGGVGAKVAVPAVGAPAAAKPTGVPWRQQQQERRARQQQQQNNGGGGAGRQQQHINGGGGAGRHRPPAAPAESVELVAARASAKANGEIVDIFSSTYSEGHHILVDAQANLAAATAEVERLLAATGGGQPEHGAQLKLDYERYLAALGADDPIVVALRKQIQADAVPESPTALAVKEAKHLLELLLEHQPDGAEAIRDARCALDQAKIANGSRESDCYQSAEAALKQAEDTVSSIHGDIEATRKEFDAIVAKQQKQAAELLAATEARDAAKKRVQDRMVAISTRAPGILQPSDAQTMGERMQQLDTVVRHVHGISAQNGGVTADAMQRVMDPVAALMLAAPSTVFTQSVTSEPQSVVHGGVIVPTAAASGTQQSARPLPALSVASLQAKFDAREAERAAAEARARNERAAEAAAIQEATAAEAAAAEAAAATAAAAARATAAGSTTAVQYQVGTTTAMAVDSATTPPASTA